jgi:serine-type D-Ala-D-Ala carboxypeptidase (penicillin-binding protein 5/6)
LVVALAAALSVAAAPALAASPPPLAVTGASLIVSGSGQRLWSENGNSELAIASTTKLMTVLVVLQHVKNLDQVFTQGDWEDEPGDSQIGLVPGEQMSVRDLLIATLVPSADDAAWDLAYNVGGGSVARFVAMMNAEAKVLGLKHTHYSTPTGLDTPGNYSSPDDLVRLADYDMHHFAFFRQTVALRSAQIEIGDHYATVENTNTLLGVMPWINGIKTGHTTDAGYVLVTSGTQEGFTLIDSVLGTDSEAQRNDAALALLDYGFEEFHLVRPLHAGQTVARVRVPYSSKRAVVVARGSVQRVVARTARVSVKPKLPHQLSGPLKKGAVVGHARVLVAGRVVAVVPLVLIRALPAESTFAKASHLIGGPFTLMLLALALGAAVVVVSRRRRPRMLAGGQMEER